MQTKIRGDNWSRQVAAVSFSPLLHVEMSLAPSVQSFVIYIAPATAGIIGQELACTQSNQVDAEYCLGKRGSTFGLGLPDKKLGTTARAVM